MSTDDDIVVKDVHEDTKRPWELPDDDDMVVKSDVKEESKKTMGNVNR